jgi:hypothetical protein
MRTIAAAFAAWLALLATAHAEPSCGNPPRVDDQTLKGDLDGKAQFLSKLVGDANLKGRIETTRTDIFSKYPNAGAAHSDAYLEYMFCSFVLSDPKLPSQEKFHAIQEFRQLTVQQPAPAAPQASTRGEQSPAVNSGGDTNIGYGAPAPAPTGAANQNKPTSSGNRNAAPPRPIKPTGAPPRPPASEQAPPVGSARTEGNQSPAVNSSGNVGIQYGSPAPVR